MTSISKLNTSRLQITEWMQACRRTTLSLFKGMNEETFRTQIHPDFSPVGWHLGHIAYTEALWILQRLAGYAPLFPEYHRLYAQDGLPKCDRVYLPSIPETLDYLAIVRSKTLDYLEVAPLAEQERLWRWLLQHECQHGETIAILLAQRSTGAIADPSIGDETLDASLGVDPSLSTPASPMVLIASGSSLQGNPSLDAIDNETPLHPIDLPDYWLDRYPVTQAEYQIFIESSGYQTRKYWSEVGWHWLQANPTTQPRYPTAPAHPVCGVSWYEADAYARFVGKRLPTEAEWEKAASWNPITQEKTLYPWGNSDPNLSLCNYQYLNKGLTSVDRYSQSLSGCHDLLGNVWEWTDTWFDGYPGFEPFPYAGYSKTYFDRAHRVLKGGSWATYQWAMRSSFRNWYHPYVREIFAGFRCACTR
jgi:gamma-glutamyl hercynylcysteine S-oxide synthase